jgi:SAM-dependent methyltransferase
MNAQLLHADSATSAYDRLAPYYDDFTAGYDHERWIEAIESLAISFGQRGRRALDIACGTGNSTAALLGRGYSVLACDISPEMVHAAQEKFPARADAFLVADMRELPELGEFDLVLCLDDGVNYLLSDADLEATFSGVSRLLARDGMFVFDVNSLRTYRSAFATAMVRESDGLFFSWRGEASNLIEPGERAVATIEVFAERDDGLWERSSSRHEQRHHRDTTIRRALVSAGLQCCSAVGQSTGARLDASVDEQRHTKVVYFARRGGSSLAF